MKPLLIILTGHAPDALRTRLGDFDHWFRHAMHLHVRDARVVDVTAGESLPPLHDIRGAIISGSAAMVTDKLAWSEQLAGWIRTAMDAELPLFGVCYGHQLMAHALGGEVGALPSGREIGTHSIEVLPAGRHDPLLAGHAATFAAHTTHKQSVLAVPAGTQILARSEQDPHHILRYGPQAVSTQLHPEFSVAVMRAYLHLRAADLRAEGLDVRRMLTEVRATSQARRLLRHFAHQTGLREQQAMAAGA